MLSPARLRGDVRRTGYLRCVGNRVAKNSFMRGALYALLFALIFWAVFLGVLILTIHLLLG